MKKLIALSVVAGIATFGAVTACSSGSPPQTADTSPTVSQQEMDAVQQWAHTWALPTTRALQQELHADNFPMAVNDGNLALNNAEERAPQSDLQDIYQQTLNEYVQAAQYYGSADYINGGRYYEEANKDYVRLLALLDNEYGMNLSGG